LIAPGRLLSLAVSAGTADRARAGIKETGEAVEPTSMSIDDQAAGSGASRWGWSRVRLPRPTGIRNGGLLLVLVALAAVVALVDEPPELGGGRRLPSIFQTLPPPTGITGLPPAVAQPPPATPAGDGRPATAVRAHPSRQHPRPAGASEPFRGDAETRAARDQGGSGPGGPAGGGSPPPVTTTPVDDAAAASVRVPPVAVRARPPALLGRDLPEVGAATPEVQLDTALP
jgi:hypothetical protein